MKKLGRAVLVLSVGLVSGLAMVAVASGSQAQVTQKVLQAPRPSGAPKNTGGLVEQVACASAKSCAATGEWLYSELGGKWRAAKLPVLAHTGGTNLRSVSCPAAHACEAVGLAGLQHAAHVSENGRQWTIGEVAPPPDAAPLAPPRGPAPFLVGVDCASARNCVAVGGYDAANSTARPQLATESNGTWSAGVEPRLPANADTSPDPNQPGLGGVLSLVSCPAAGDCTAVGLYTNRDAGHGFYPWVLTESGGTWSFGQEALLPEDAAQLGDPEKGGGSPFMGFSRLSCPSAGNCTAVGGYADKNGGDEGLILTERDGVWSQGVKAPLPPKAVPHSDPNEFDSPLVSVSCAAPDDCAAVGWYVTAATGGKKQGLLLSERSGKWKASPLVLPAKANASTGVFLTSVSCPSRGNCLAVGYYAGKGKTHGVLVRERAGRWGRATNAALPKGASSQSHTFLNSVFCPSASSCTVGGDYKARRSGKPQGLILNVRLR
jgi:hypothetical protein